MIFGKVDVSDKSEFPKRVQEALDYFLRTNFSVVKDGKYPLRGEQMFAVVSTYNTFPREEKKPESHQKYIDVQYIISGAEKTGVSYKGTHEGAYDAEKDLQFYSGVEGEQDFLLSQGHFAVFFPSDIHRPCLHAAGDATGVRKAVVKISLAYLGAAE